MTRRRTEVRPWLLAVLLAAVHLGLTVEVFDPTPFTGGDNAGYIALAVSLLRRHAYLEIWNPLAPPHTQYPPVFPLVLAVGRVLGLRTWVGAKLIVVAFSTLAVTWSFVWLRRWHSTSLAFFVGLLLALSPGILDLSHWTLSDVPFWALAMIALWAAARVDGTDPTRPAPAVVEEQEVAGEETAIRETLEPALWITIVATTLAYFTRSAGLPLAVAVGAWLLWRRRWRALAALVVVLGIPALLWWLRSRATGGVHYLRQLMQVDPYRPALGRVDLHDMLARFADNVVSYATIHLPVLLFGRPGTWLAGLSIALLTFAFMGWAIRARRPGVAELFLPLYLGLLLIWPAVWAGDRFLLPALPLLLGFAAVALLWLPRRLGHPAGRAIGVVAVLSFVAVSAPRVLEQLRSGTDCTAAYEAGDPYPCLSPPFIPFFTVAQWARDSLPVGAPVLSRKPRLFWALSGHTGDIYPESKEPGAFFDRVRRTGARYLVVDELGDLTAFYVGPTLTAFPQGFCIEYLAPGGGAALLRIRPGADRLPGRVAPLPEQEYADVALCSALDGGAALPVD